MRSKINDSHLEHFVDYITSSHVVKDLPYGTRNLKLSSGEVVEVPNLIRCLSPSSLVSQYTQYCDAEEVAHLGEYNIHKSIF